jgi:excisionase family DNA binding protein
MDEQRLETSAEMAQRLKISRQFLHKLTVACAVPAYKFGRNFRYSAEEVLAAVKTRKRRRQGN